MASRDKCKKLASLTMKYRSCLFMVKREPEKAAIHFAEAREVREQIVDHVMGCKTCASFVVEELLELLYKVKV